MDIEQGYDEIAHDYAEQFSDELSHAPFDRALLDEFARQLTGKGQVVDLGCGPGQITSYLQRRGLQIEGLDLCEKMVKEASERFPQISFEQGSMLELPYSDRSLVGVTGFYAIVHFEPQELMQALGQIHRVLKPGGLGLLSYHMADERNCEKRELGQEVELEFVLYSRTALQTALTEAGFEILVDLERAPHKGYEEGTRRGYVWFQKT